MKASFRNGSVHARCPGCGVVTSFESSDQGKHFGSLSKDGVRNIPGARFQRTIYVLQRCASCGRGGLAELLANATVADAHLFDFYPHAPVHAHVPKDVPTDILAELREAETCAAAGAPRAALAMFRSVLEKTMKANGFTKGTLAAKIVDAHGEGFLSDTRKLRAEQIKNIGNDVLHDPRRDVDDVEVEENHTYTQRILEDFYDSRATVEDRLRQKKRLPL